MIDPLIHNIKTQFKLLLATLILMTLSILMFSSTTNAAHYSKVANSQPLYRVSKDFSVVELLDGFAQQEFLFCDNGDEVFNSKFNPLAPHIWRKAGIEVILEERTASSIQPARVMGMIYNGTGKDLRIRLSGLITMLCLDNLPLR